MQQAVRAARKAARTLQSRARDASRALAVLEAELGDPLDSFEIPPGEIPDVVLDHIRAAAEGEARAIRIVVLAVTDRPDPKEQHVSSTGSTQGSRNGHARERL